jgi:hypothetical protein
MPFDITLAIAEFNVRDANANGYDALRERYPEIAYVFDKLEDLEAEFDGMVDAQTAADAEEDAYRAHSALNDCAARFAQLRDMVLTLARFDRLDPEGEELVALSGKADEGFEYARTAASV